MADRYLLYIDLLGFADLVSSDHAGVERLYRKIDALNVHQHQSFRTIVFSDTILVYNTFEPTCDDHHNYAVMYSCEFAHDLLVRLAGRNLFFRAVLDYGDFTHYELVNIECFFGKSLIAAYLREKALPAVGMFMSQAASRYNRIFPTASFGQDLEFVFLTQAIQRLQENTGGVLPADPVFDLTDDYASLVEELLFLASVHDQMRNHTVPSVRAKHLATFDLYRRQYPQLMAALEAGQFRPQCVSPTLHWERYTRNSMADWE